MTSLRLAPDRRAKDVATTAVLGLSAAGLTYLLTTTQTTIVAMGLLSTGLFALGWRGAVAEEGKANLLDPRLLPTAYVLTSALLPLIVVAVFGEDIGFLTPERMTERFLATTMIHVVLFQLGLLLAIRLSSSHAAKSEPIARDAWLGIGRMARAVSFLLIGVFAAHYLALAGQPYGIDQLSYRPSQVAASFAGILVAPTALLLSESSFQISKRLSAQTILILAAMVALTAASGDRFVALAIAVSVAWSFNRSIRRISVREVAAGVLLILLVFAAITAYRSGTPLASKNVQSVALESVAAIASPSSLTALMIDLGPNLEHVSGATYTAVVPYLLPGPIARATFGELTGTGSLLFRDIVGIQNDSHGYSFALVSESYLNFGIAGVAVVSFALGLLLAWFSRLNSRGLSKAPMWMYPVLLAELPLLLRSDFLTQTKTLLYGFLFIAAVLHVANRRVASSP